MFIMSSSDILFNCHLKREILLLASEISAASPRNTLGTEEYIVTREELRGIDISDQNIVLKRHLDILREVRRSAQSPESSLTSSLMKGDVGEKMSPQSAQPISIFESPKKNQPHRNGTISDAQRTGKLTQRCRSALLCWLKDEAADNTFQPADSDQLLKAACAFLKRAVLTEAQELRLRYAHPSRFSRVITHRDNLWSAFQHLRSVESVPPGEPHALSIEHLSTKPSRGHA